MAQPEIIDKPKRWRRIGWYSLAMVVLTLIGLYAFAFWRYEQQQAAIAEIERLGGYTVTRHGGPELLRGLVGDERMKVFDRVVSVDFQWAVITDDSLRHLSALTNLEALNLDGTRVTDDGLRRLSDLTSLVALTLDHTQITDDGLRHLCGLTRLAYLDLNHTQVTDDGLQHLSGMNLLQLTVTNTQVTKDGAMLLDDALPHCAIVRE